MFRSLLYVSAMRGNCITSEMRQQFSFSCYLPSLGLRIREGTLEDAYIRLTLVTAYYVQPSKYS
jgi:hypothetical protein